MSKSDRSFISPRAGLPGEQSAEGEGPTAPARPHDDVDVRPLVHLPARGAPADEHVAEDGLRLGPAVQPFEVRSEPGQGSGEPEDDPDPHEAAVQDEPDEGMESDPKEENRWQGVPEGPQCDQGPSLQQGARGDLRERVPPDPLDEPAAHEFLRDPLLAVREDPVQDRVRAPPLNVTRVRGALASPRRPAAAPPS